MYDRQKASGEGIVACSAAMMSTQAWCSLQPCSATSPPGGQNCSAGGGGGNIGSKGATAAHHSNRVGCTPQGNRTCKFIDLLASQASPAVPSLLLPSTVPTLPWVPAVPNLLIWPPALNVPAVSSSPRPRFFPPPRPFVLPLPHFVEHTPYDGTREVSTWSL